MHTSILRLTALYFFSLLLLINTAAAQYKGGIDDGVSTFSAINQPLGQNIYLGGTDDGHSIFFTGNQALGQNIFLGGPDDGISSFTLLNQPLGQNIYLGGVDDGHAMYVISNGLLGQNIYLGGIDDGFTAFSNTNQPLGQNIYLGGMDDGWAFAMGTNLTLVPLTLRSFEASWKNEEDILTRWVTSMESNTDHFEVQRSINGSSFENAGNIPAAGNSNMDRTYTFIDLKVNDHYTTRPPYFFYRLKTVDKDGRIHYSAIVVVKNTVGAANESITLYPNPATQYITIEFKTSATIFAPRTAQLFSGDGKLMLQKNITNLKEMIQVGNYPSGAYYLKIIEPVSKNIQTIKFIIQH